MPSTPGQADDDSVDISLPAGLPTPHASCPPEDDRDYRTPQTQWASMTSDVVSDQDATTEQLPTPAAEVESGSVEDMDTTETEHTTVKRSEDEEDILMRHAPSPSSLVEEPKDNDARLAQSMATTALSSSVSPWASHPSNANRVRACCLVLPNFRSLLTCCRCLPIRRHPSCDPAANSMEHSSRIVKCTMSK